MLYIAPFWTPFLSSCHKEILRALFRSLGVYLARFKGLLLSKSTRMSPTTMSLKQLQHQTNIVLL
jgi:hypothetical protein